MVPTDPKSFGQFAKDNAWSGLFTMLLFLLFFGAWHAAKWNETEFYRFCDGNFRTIAGTLLGLAGPPAVRTVLAGNRASDNTNPPTNGTNGKETK